MLLRIQLSRETARQGSKQCHICPSAALGLTLAGQEVLTVLEHTRGTEQPWLLVPTLLSIPELHRCPGEPALGWVSCFQGYDSAADPTQALSLDFIDLVCSLQMAIKKAATYLWPLESSSEFKEQVTV